MTSETDAPEVPDPQDPPAFDERAERLTTLVDDGGDGNGPDAEAGLAEEEESGGSGTRALVDWIIVVAVALLVAFVVRGFVLAHFVVDGSSMYSTLESGDRVFVNKLSYRLHDPNRGDVVVLHQISGASERDLIKRVIALPGETIEMRSCTVLITAPGEITARQLNEPYLDPSVVTPNSCGGDFEPQTVPDDHVFVMGDNRAGSQDSRLLGPISEDDLVGRAFVVFWPRDNWRWL